MWEPHMSVSEYNAEFDDNVSVSSAPKGIILKIFDPTRAKDNHSNHQITSYEDRVVACENAFKTETEIYSDILLYNSSQERNLINLPTIYKTGFLKLLTKGGQYSFCGLFIAMLNLGSEKPSSAEDFDKGDKQLSLIHGRNIIHGDIKHDNVVMNEGNFFFIDYGFSSMNGKYADRSLENDIVAMEQLRAKTIDQTGSSLSSL